MREWLRNLREILHGSLWFIPGLMTALAMALAGLALALDRAATLKTAPSWLYQGDQHAAREVVGVIAVSVIGVAGVAFSITMVALSLAGSQFGTLQLSSYLRDRLNQFVLGTFVGTFVYCLIVLGNIGVRSEPADVIPGYAVTVALLLAIASLAAFIAFIHNVGQSLQAERLASRVGRWLLDSIHAFFPDQPAVHAVTTADLPDREAPVQAVCAHQTGYLQTIEYERAVHIAVRDDLVVCLDRHAGDFVTEGTVIGRIYGAAPGREAALARELADCHLIGSVRTPTQDPEYSVHQLAQIAVRAMSPAINDPYTALICIDWMDAALRVLARRDMPSGFHHDRAGKLRLVAVQPGFPVVADAVFNKLRIAVRSHQQLMLRLVNMVESVVQDVHREEDLRVLARHLDWVAEDGEHMLPVAREREFLRARYAEVKAVLAARMAAVPTP
ncbi:MAG: DUF2254 domain-containing protein [Thiohalomonadaceae bacterium]